MSELYPTDPIQYLGVLTVFLRVLGLFLLVPVFSHKAIPMTVKVILALSFSLALHPVVRPHLETITPNIATLAWTALRETLIGLAMGFVAHLTFEAINLGAHFVGFQMGFGTATLLDPQAGAQVSVVTPFQGWLALLVFLLADFHHGVLIVFVKSFEVTAHLNALVAGHTSALQFLITATGKLFVLSVQMAAPFTFIMLACNILVGLLSRLLPQMNILLFSFPITITLGLGAMYLLAPEMLEYFEQILGDVSGNLVELLRTA
ncbi:MAG: flagellar biosynthetic protein FliR [Deltaproteobacteria bacterium]|nr:flagellar biosynthetic protein FliR [Deltaproteobacteria bacterium]MBI3295014.1 flagellar biosynthetic protein FliR [Deltaproteobacteria bacterium]